MDGILVIGIIAAVAFFTLASKPSQAAANGMEDTPVSADNIRRGVTNGWYTCVLVYVDGIPAVRLSGRTADGKLFTDVYPVTQTDWDALATEGYQKEI